MKNKYEQSQNKISSYLPVVIWILMLISPFCEIKAQDSLKDSTQQAVASQKILHPDSAKVTVNPDSIDTQTRMLADYNFEEDEKSLDTAIRQNEKLLQKFPDDPFIKSAMFQLSELYVRKARHIYRREMVEYEQNYKLFEAGKRSLEPILPTIKLGKAIEMCYDILDRFPKVNFKDRIFYRLAICHLDEGNRDKAKKYFNMLAFEFPKSAFIAEAHFRIGEYHFNKRDFHQAIKHFSQLLESWDNSYFNMSLYKLGWSYYNVEDYVNSITTFVYLLSDIRLLEQAKTKVLGKTNSELRQEAIDYIAICFTEYGGAVEAKRFLVTRKKGSEDYNLHVFLKMGDIYQNRNFYSESIETYKAILETWPFYQYAPVIQQKIVDAYEADMVPESAMEARVQLVEQYGPGSKWLNQYPEGQVRSDAIQQAEKALYDYATYFQSVAQEKKRRREYLIAAEKYREYLKKFPRSDKASEVNFFLAECLYEVEKYEEAAEEYAKALNNYGPSKHQEAAAYNRILSFYNILENAPQADTLTFYLEDFLGDQSVQPDPIKVGNKVQKDLLVACNDFIVMLPKSERVEEVLVKFAETLYNLRQYKLAANVYARIIKDFKDGSYYSMAYNLLAQSYFQAGDYDAASKTSEEIMRVFADSASFVAKAKKLVASSGFKRAESFGQKNEPVKAAASYAKVADNTTDPEIAKRAILRASAQYDSLGNYKKAVRVLETLVNKKPEFKYAPEILFKAASLHEREEQWNWAVIDYMKIVDRYPDFKLAAKAHFNTGVCYENMEKWQLAESTYNRFVATTYQEYDPDDVLSALYRIGEMKYNSKNFAKAVRAFHKTIRKYIDFKKALKSADEYYPAKAQYLMAEITNEQFKKTKIQDPLEKTLLRKKQLFNVTLKNYSNAIKFNIAEWSTASFFKIGNLYEEYAVALTSIPLGVNLTPTQIEAQRAKIRNELKQQALKYYRSNVRKAEKAEIQNEWVDQSRKRMQTLILELRIGSEVGQVEGTGKTANKLN